MSLRSWPGSTTSPAGSKAFDKRIAHWKEETGRRAECDSWTKREEIAVRLGAKSKLAESLKDTKLSCALFGQELDDDGWVPMALTEHNAAADEHKEKAADHK